MISPGHLLLALALLCAPSGYGQGSARGHWKPIEFLIGTWKQRTDSSTITHTYAWVMEGQFIRSQTDARFHPPGDNESTHQDVGYFSYDKDRRTIVFRQFHSEGFVNTYALDNALSSDTLIVLTSEHTENAGGMRARLTISRKSGDTYGMILYLAGKEGEFKPCQWIHAVKSL